ncbi:MAG: transcription elongation factor GreA [Clostridiales bacterium]|nr:transcription elongation factor GreA [Clostridiales bacterium]
MQEKEVVLTKEGLLRLEQEQENLKAVKRREVAERIKQAIEFGDISENSEFEDAKNEQAFIEGRILTLEKMLRNVKVIEDTEEEKNHASLGSTVTLIDLDLDETLEYTIVGAAEANPMNNRISFESPVGAAILGHVRGDEIEVQVPAGVVKFRLEEIR